MFFLTVILCDVHVQLSCHAFFRVEFYCLVNINYAFSVRFVSKFMMNNDMSTEGKLFS